MNESKLVIKARTNKTNGFGCTVYYTRFIFVVVVFLSKNIIA